MHISCSTFHSRREHWPCARCVRENALDDEYLLFQMTCGLSVRMEIAERCCLKRADAQTGPDDWMQCQRDYRLTDPPNPTQLKCGGAHAIYTHLSVYRSRSLTARSATDST